MVPIDKQAAIDICNFAIDLWRGQLGEGIVIAVRKKIEQLPSVQPDIIRCKDCRKHNISVGYQKDCCPLYQYRGMSFGDEHDLQFCSFAERRTDE